MNISGPSFFNTIPSKLLEGQRQPFRVYFDYSLFNDRRDSGICWTVGQSTSYGACKDTDIMTPQKINVLKTTFDNLATYLTDLINVTRLAEPITVQGIRDIPVSGTKDCDIYIGITTRSYHDSVLAAAFPHRYDSTGRPTVGGIYVNPEFIPDTPEDFDSFEDFFFTTVFHEIVHALGFVSGMYSSWIDRRTKQRYTNPVTRVSKYGKSFSFIQTPAIQRFIEDRFGTSSFNGMTPIGAEIEDGGGGGTAGSHFESRIYMGEVMCGILFGYPVISNLTLSLLEDTGWYDVDYSRSQPFMWGDSRSYNKPDEKLNQFVTSSPQIGFPKHYICWPDQPMDEVCNYDLRSKANCRHYAKWNCNNPRGDDSKACSIKELANPLDLPYRGNHSEFDFLWFKVPDAEQRCDDVTLNPNAKNGEFYGDQSVCAMSTLASSTIVATPKPMCYKMLCNKNYQLFIKIGDQTKLCSYEDQELEFSGFTGKVKCPNSDIACGMKQYLGRPFENIEPVEPILTPEPTKITTLTQSKLPTRSQFPAATEKSEEHIESSTHQKYPTELFLGLSITFFVLGLIAIGATLVWWFKCNHKKANIKSMKNSNKSNASDDIEAPLTENEVQNVLGNL